MILNIIYSVIGGFLTLFFMYIGYRVFDKFTEFDTSEELAKDKSRTQVSEVSSFGLVEMTRKHVSEGLVETFSEVCPTCSGRGLLLHEDAAALGNPIPPSSDGQDGRKG